MKSLVLFSSVILSALQLSSATMSHHPLNLTNPGRKVHAGVILMGGVTELLDVAPMDLVNGLSPAFVKAFPEALAPYSNDTIDIEWHWVNEHGTEAKMTAGMIVKATDSFKSSPQLDIVMIGAHNAPYQANKAELAFIAKQYEGCTAFLAICGGFEAPLQAGIYKGKTATAPRFIIPHLKQTVTDVNWVEKRYEHDGKLWTSGALTNGLDMVVAWGTSVWGNKEDTLLGTLLPLGSWPSRDVDYKDGP